MQVLGKMPIWFEDIDAFVGSNPIPNAQHKKSKKIKTPSRFDKLISKTEYQIFTRQKQPIWIDVSHSKCLQTSQIEHPEFSIPQNKQIHS